MKLKHLIKKSDKEGIPNFYFEIQKQYHLLLGTAQIRFLKKPNKFGTYKKLC